MLFKDYFPTPATLLLLGIPLSAAPTAPVPSRLALEGAYQGWRSALTQKDLRSWQYYTADYRRIQIRNTIVSQKQPFPQAVLERPVLAPALTGLRFLGIRTGDRTASASYFGPVDFGLPPGDEIPDNLLILHFVHEEARWRFDRAQYLNLEARPEIRREIEQGGLGILEEPSLQPQVQPPPLPPLCRAPEYIAKVFAEVPGLRAEVDFGGSEVYLFEDERRADLIIGGLQRGVNKISYRLGPLEKTEENAPLPNKEGFEISVWIMPEREGQIPVRVFQEKILPGETPLKKRSALLSITAQNLAGRNPAK
ncbi:MAG: hypothetical protein AAF555_10460 [Verrucomicrobiota bacterium]